jgi:hypothetical protein
MFSRFYRTRLEWRRVAIYEPVGVAGTALVNADGSDRQTVLETCHAGMRVVLRRAPSDLDRNAIALFVNDGRQIGQLPANVAEWIAPLLDSGKTTFDAEIWLLRRNQDGQSPERFDCRLLLTQHDLMPVKRFSWSGWLRGDGRSRTKVGVR